MSEFKVTYLPSPEFDSKKYHEGIRELLYLVKLQEEMDRVEGAIEKLISSQHANLEIVMTSDKKEVIKCLK